MRPRVCAVLVLLAFIVTGCITGERPTVSGGKPAPALPPNPCRVLSKTEVGALFGEEAVSTRRPGTGKEVACTWRSAKTAASASLLDVTVATTASSASTTTSVPGVPPVIIRGTQSATAAVQGLQDEVSIVVEGLTARLVYSPADHNPAAHLDALKGSAATVASRLAAAG